MVHWGHWEIRKIADRRDLCFTIQAQTSQRLLAATGTDFPERHQQRNIIDVQQHHTDHRFHRLAAVNVYLNILEEVRLQNINHHRRSTRKGNEHNGSRHFPEPTA